VDNFDEIIRQSTASKPEASTSKDRNIFEMSTSLADMFGYMSDHHGLTLTDTEMHDIINVCAKYSNADGLAEVDELKARIHRMQNEEIDSMHDVLAEREIAQNQRDRYKQLLGSIADGNINAKYLAKQALAETGE
jgi:hypothetical protein